MNEKTIDDRHADIICKVNLLAHGDAAKVDRGKVAHEVCEAVGALAAEVKRLAVEKTITVTRRASDFHAAIDGTGGRLWGAGRTPDEAIGGVVRCHADALGIKVVLP